MNKPAMSAQNRGIVLHTDPADFEGMRRAGRLAAQVLDFMAEAVKPEITTLALNDICHKMILDAGAIPAPLGYRGFPKSICTSVNHVVCHGIPGPKPLRDGDIVNIDVTLIVDGWHGDTSRMYPVGNISRRAERLIRVTYEALRRGIAVVRPGVTTGHIGAAIQAYAEAERCSIVRDFCGHGLGRVFHDRPNILHYGKAGTGPLLKPGMFFTVEPMVNAGTWQVKVLGDGWTAVTRDKQLSAQFEHSVGITETGVEFFTLSPKGLAKPPYDLGETKTLQTATA